MDLELGEDYLTAPWNLISWFDPNTSALEAGVPKELRGRSSDFRRKETMVGGREKEESYEVRNFS